MKIKKIQNKAKPDYLLCVGAQKAGTSWLYEQMKYSSEVEFAKFKEIHYFDYKFGHSKQLIKRQAKIIYGKCHKKSLSLDETLENIPSDEWYVSLFKDKNNIKADFTPEYALLNKLELRVVKELLGNVKSIFLMRDPRARALSALKYFYGNRNVDMGSVDIDILKKRAKSKLISSRTDYPKTLNTYMNILGENFKYYYYEDIMKDKENSLKEICKFIGIPYDFSSDTNKIINQGRKNTVASELKEYIWNIYEPIVYETEKITGRVPDSWKEDLK